MGEFNLYGVYVPTLLVQTLLAYVLFRICSPLLNKWANQGWLLFPGIFNLCFYLLVLLIVHQLFVWVGI